MLSHINEIKRRRLPETFLIDMIDNMYIVQSDNNYYYGIDGYMIFHRDIYNMTLSSSERYIWSVFERKFGYDTLEIEKIIERVVSEKLNWINYKHYSLGDSRKPWELIKL